MKFDPTTMERIMKREGLNRSKMAGRLGVSRSTVTRLLNGNVQPSVKLLSAIKQQFPEVSLEYFFREDGA